MADIQDAMRDIEKMMGRLEGLNKAVKEAEGSESPAQEVANDLNIDMDNMLIDPDALSATPEEAEELFESLEAQNAKKLADGISDYLTR